MNKSDEILNKLLNIEAIANNIYKEIISIKKDNEGKNVEQFQIMARIENIADFVKTRYNVMLEEDEKFVTETMENNKIL